MLSLATDFLDMTPKVKQKKEKENVNKLTSAKFVFLESKNIRVKSKHRMEEGICK